MFIAALLRPRRPAAAGAAACITGAGRHALVDRGPGAAQQIVKSEPTGSAAAGSCCSTATTNPFFHRRRPDAPLPLSCESLRGKPTHTQRRASRQQRERGASARYHLRLLLHNHAQNALSLRPPPARLRWRR